ncbi:EcsC family protein [Paenibacillus sp. GD4]|jgi:hypothetical protein|uniref:EcsC family protein n=1 Tax=Paenibacillus sp. GD4 TaxID=3068890 RepID=UPI002796B2F8|nr:EcsC family protein [Paenibacillus sp. GD4]MDQ1910743.1 EcsC family protein [Paenibacillus sp. GD4]
MIESREELTAALRQVEAWEAGQKDLWFWEKLGRLPFEMLDRITPQSIQTKIGEALGDLGAYVQSGGQYLVSDTSVLKAFQAKVPDVTFEEIRGLPIRTMDAVAEEISRRSALAATAQGATTGFGGVLTLAIDIPAILGMSLKLIQEIALAYGYDPREQHERAFVIKCLQFASSDIVGKKAILHELGHYGQQEAQNQMISQLQGWREVFQTYRDNFGWKKLFQLVPVLGMFFGAYVNRSAIQDLAEAGQMLYRKRRILERLQAE